MIVLLYELEISMRWVVDEAESKAESTIESKAESTIAW